MLSKLSIRNKLIVILILPIVAMVTMVSLALKELSDLNRGVTRIYEDRVVPLETLKKISDDYAVLIVDTVNKANAGLIGANQSLKVIRDARQEVQSKWRAYKATELTAKESQLIQQAESLFAIADPQLNRLESRLSEFDSDADLKNRLNDIDGKLYQYIDPVSNKLAELVKLQLDVAAEERKNTAEIYDLSVMLQLLIGALVTLSMTVIGFLVYRSIRQPLHKLSGLMHEVATNSDLTLVAQPEGGIELENMAQSFNTMISHQRDLIQEISRATNQLTASAEEMSTISVQTKDNTQKQRQDIKQVTHSMQQMLASTEEVSANVESANQRAKSGLKQSDDGNIIVQNAVQSTNALVNNVGEVAQRIDSVVEHSENIDSVIGVINTIADQTNLLALNAAIEAARAGEQGRGFSVVADEVRKLAQKTQQSTTETQEAIQRLQAGIQEAVNAMRESQEEAEHTGEKASQVGEALRSISSSMQEITDSNASITAVSEEQSAVAAEISSSLTSINDVSEEAFDGAQHISSASQELTTLASELNNRVNTFKF